MTLATVAAVLSVISIVSMAVAGADVRRLVLRDVLA